MVKGVEMLTNALRLILTFIFLTSSIPSFYATPTSLGVQYLAPPSKAAQVVKEFPYSYWQNKAITRFRKVLASVTDDDVKKVIVEEAASTARKWCLEKKYDSLQENYYRTHLINYWLKEAGLLGSGNVRYGREFKPTAELLPAELQGVIISYKESLAKWKRKGGDTALRRIGRRTYLYDCDLDGGTGVNMNRREHKRKALNDPTVEMGSKSTDLFFDFELVGKDKKEAPKKVNVKLSVMEFRNLKRIMNLDFYKGIHFSEFVSDETLPSLLDFLNNQIVVWDRIDETIPKAQKRTWGQYLVEMGIKGIDKRSVMVKGRMKELFYPFEVTGVFPNIDAKNKTQITRAKITHGGHGYFGVFALLKRTLELYETHRKAIDRGESVMISIANGDGPNNTVTREMMGSVVESQAGLVMVTTEKTTQDKKGGQLGKTAVGSVSYMDIFEVGQIPKTDQTAASLFQEMGLRVSDSIQDFNTNTIIINVGVVAPMLAELRDILGSEDEFFNFMMPSNIPNPQKDENKIIVGLAMEGAMGSALLNLVKNMATSKDVRINALWERNQGFFKLARVEKDYRSDFFTPNKTAIDFWQMALSDHFERKLEQKEDGKFDISLKNTRPGHFTTYKFEEQSEDWYNNVSHLEIAFGKMSTHNLDELQIRGRPVLIPDTILEGDVRIVNNSARAEVLQLKDELIDMIRHNTLPPEVRDHIYITQGPMFAPRLVIKDVKIVVSEAYPSAVTGYLFKVIKTTVISDEPQSIAA